MKDPALGRTRAERALGEALPRPAAKQKKTTLKKPRSAVNDIRSVNNGQFSGPRPSYGRYNVSEQAKDVLNRSLNKKTR